MNLSTNPTYLSFKAALDLAVAQAKTVVKETKAAAILIFVAGVLSGCVLF